MKFYCKFNRTSSPKTIHELIYINYKILIGNLGLVVTTKRIIKKTFLYYERKFRISKRNAEIPTPRSEVQVSYQKSEIFTK